MSIKKNFIYSSILTVSNYIFPFITFPYVSRVLGVTNIGTCNFVDSISNYFILFSMMGMSYVGIREIAKNNTTREELSKCFNSLFFLNAITTILSILIFIVAILFVPKFQDYQPFLFLGVIKVLFSFLSLDWFFKGIEDFKFITVRGIIVRLLYVLSVFILVKDESDTYLYYLLSTLMIVFTAFINLYYTKRFIRFEVSTEHIKEYLKPFVVLGIYIILTSMYTTFNVAYLGFVADDTEVGYYSTATKIFSIILAIFTAYVGVMMPRMSHVIAEKKFDLFVEYFDRSITNLIAIAIPLILFSELFTKEIIEIISGSGYEGAIVPMQMVMPLVFIIGYEQILVIQTLLPLGKDKDTFKNSVIGAVVGIVLNIIIVPYLKSTGAAIVWILSEIVVLLLSFRSVRKYVSINFQSSQLFKTIIAYIPLLLVLVAYRFVIRDISTWRIIAPIILSAGYFVMVNLCVIKNKDILSLIKLLKLRKNE